MTNCEKFYLDGACAECQANYSLIDGQCMSGIACANTAFRIFNNSCVRKTLNCLRYTGMRCNSCERGFYLNTNFTCSANPLGCLSFFIPLGCT